MFKIYCQLTLFLVAILTVGGCASDAGNSTVNSPPVYPSPEPAPANVWIETIDGQLQQQLEQNSIPGMAVALVQDNEIVLSKGYGFRDVENQFLVDADTLFHIASTHKAINATLIAALVDEGTLSWDVGASQYYSNFRLSNAQSTEQVTLTHLLSMTSGIPDDVEDALYDDATTEDLFTITSEAELLGAPQKVFSYSNISASIAGYIAVVASFGNDANFINNYAALLREKVLDPIGMTRSTSFVSNARQDGNFSKSYSISSGQPVLEASYDVDQDILAPSGSLKSSSAEMALFVAAHLNQGVAMNQTRIVSKENLHKTYQPILESYALGWETLT